MFCGTEFWECGYTQTPLSDDKSTYCSVDWSNCLHLVRPIFTSLPYRDIKWLYEQTLFAYEGNHFTPYSDVLLTVLTWLLLVTQSVFLWLLLSYIQRYSLKALLCYQGWMFDERGCVCVCVCVCGTEQITSSHFSVFGREL